MVGGCAIGANAPRLACLPEAACAGGPSEGRAAQAKRVLVLDDQDMILEVACEMLMALGYEPEGAGDGRKAIEKYAAAMKDGRRFDLAIMDLIIPGGMGGKDAAREILAIDPEARLLASSGFVEDPVMVNPSQFGFKGVVPKPYNLAQLRKIVTDAIAR
jgi:CheY-like chemotaxis protein